ncbi:MAG: siroheme synthase CysG [Gammaproteobacteria bacterium]|nr:siroheme synthase CysG [Gammaproteobacteria bacterium]
MDYLPIFMNLKQTSCLVVGGGGIAARKVSLLLKAEADVTVVSPELCDELARWQKEGRISYQARAFEDDDVKSRKVIIAATDKSAVNVRVSELAHALNVPVNVVDHPKLCSFIMPSIIDRSPVQIAISTGGASPVLARLIRTELEGRIPAEYGQLGKLVENYRAEVKKTFGDVEQRRDFWEKVLNGPVAEQVFAGKMDRAEVALQKALDEGKSQPTFEGEVYLVGAGPGDPDLLTFRALRLMQQADVVVYDRLVSPAIMELVRRDSELIYVGKERDNHAVPQEGINQLLVKHAKEGKRVLRLKGGDPFIFGRGGEEIDTLADEGVAFQVVPGITAAAGCSTYSGIPLTHRDYAQSVVFVTGNLKNNTVDLNWKGLAIPNQTIVFYMGLRGVNEICKQLVAHGLPESTPAALVSQGTTPNHQTLIGDLSSLPSIVENNELKAPTLIIVGEVVSLHNKLKWFESEEEHRS